MESHFYYYDAARDAVVMTDNKKWKFMVGCVDANASINVRKLEEMASLVRLAREHPAEYMLYALTNKLQDYVNSVQKNTKEEQG